MVERKGFLQRFRIKKAEEDGKIAPRHKIKSEKNKEK